MTQGNQLYYHNGNGGSSEPESSVDPAGSGTQSDPYNVAAAQKVISDGTYTSDKVYVKGIISSITEISTSYGNATYYISDDGTTTGQLMVYRGYGLNGNKFTSESDIKVGDEVVVYGELTNFKGNTPEVTQGSQIVSLNGSGDTGGDDSKTTTLGTYDSPYTVAQAQAAYNAGTTGNTYVKAYIVGYVDGNSFETGATFAVPSVAQTEILIADNASETNASNCLPVQLPKGDIRDGLELSAHTSYLGQEVLIYGSLEGYFKVAGIKSTSYAEINGTTIGTKPE